MDGMFSVVKRNDRSIVRIDEAFSTVTHRGTFRMPSGNRFPSGKVLSRWHKGGDSVSEIKNPKEKLCTSNSSTLEGRHPRVRQNQSEKFSSSLPSSEEEQMTKETRESGTLARKNVYLTGR